MIRDNSHGAHFKILLAGLLLWLPAGFSTLSWAALSIDNHAIKHANAANEANTTSILTHLKKKYPPVRNVPVTERHIQPLDVYARLKWYQHLFSELSIYMGIEHSNESVFTVHQAAPSDVILQINSIAQKTDRLSTQTGISSTHINDLSFSRSARVKPYHVWLQATQATHQLLSILEKLQIDITAKESMVNGSITPTDVYNLALIVNKNIDQAMIAPVSQSDVYAQVTQAINIMGDLINESDDLNPYPKPDTETPGFITDRTVFHKIHDILKITGPILKPTPRNNKEKSITHTIEITKENIDFTAGDSYNLMNLVLSDLIQLHKQNRGKPPIKPYYSGVQYPRNTYRRLSILEKQINLYHSLRER